MEGYVNHARKLRCAHYVPSCTMVCCPASCHVKSATQAVHASLMNAECQCALCRVLVRKALHRVVASGQQSCTWQRQSSLGQARSPVVHAGADTGEL